MERKGFVYEVRTQLLLTVAEVAILVRLSYHHYDALCRSASKVGGFIYGIQNRVNFAQEDDSTEVPSLLTWREVDTMCKILEQAKTDEECTLAWEMRGLLLDMSAEQRRMNDLP